MEEPIKVIGVDCAPNLTKQYLANKIEDQIYILMLITMRI